MKRLIIGLSFLLLSASVLAMTNTEAIQFVNRYYDLLNQYAQVQQLANVDVLNLHI